MYYLIYVNTSMLTQAMQFKIFYYVRPRLFRQRWSAAACLLGLWVGIPPRAWTSFSCRCCMLSGRGLFVGWSLVQRGPTDCGMSECDREASIMRRPWPTGGCWTMDKKGRRFIKSENHGLCLSFLSSYCFECPSSAPRKLYILRNK